MNYGPEFSLVLLTEPLESLYLNFVLNVPNAVFFRQRRFAQSKIPLLE